MAMDKSAKSTKGVSGPQTTARTGGAGPTDKLAKYWAEVQAELRKTTWPSKPELIAQTQVVLGLLVIIGVFIAAWDFLLGQIFQGILRVMGVETR